MRKTASIAAGLIGALAVMPGACSQGSGKRASPGAAGGEEGGGSGGGGAGGARDPARDAASGGTGAGGAGGANPARDAASEAPAARADAGGAVPASDAGAPAASGSVNVLTHKYDNLRTGWNRNEKLLKPANVTPATFGKLFSIRVEGTTHAQPLLVTGLDVGGKTRNVLYLVTTNDKAFAFDADDARATAPLWMAQFGTITPPATPCMYERGGIIATPVIDLESKTMFFVVKSFDNGVASVRLVALDIVTGAPRPGSPVAITASVAGTAPDAVNGMVKLDPVRQRFRPGLLLQGGRLYIGSGSEGDSCPWHGWILAYDPATLKQTAVFNTTPDGAGGAVWMSGNGLAGDGTNVYFSTGNGAARPDATHLAEAFVKLDRDLKLLDWHVRGNYATLDAADADYGTSGPLLVPNTNLAVMAGKDAWAFVYDRGNLGKFKADDTNTLQKFKGNGTTFSGFHMGGFVYWEGPAGNGPTLYAWPGSSKLVGFRFNGTKFDEQPTVVAANSVSTFWWSGVMVGSSDGPSNGIIWASVPAPGTDANARPSPGRLRAHDATNGNLLWESTMNNARDDSGIFAYSFPIVANGRVYVSDWGPGTGKEGSDVAAISVYGLLP